MPNLAAATARQYKNTRFTVFDGRRRNCRWLQRRVTR
jgi:hypothetical protein